MNKSHTPIELLTLVDLEHHIEWTEERISRLARNRLYAGSPQKHASMTKQLERAKAEHAALHQRLSDVVAYRKSKREAEVACG